METNSIYDTFIRNNSGDILFSLVYGKGIENAYRLSIYESGIFELNIIGNNIKQYNISSININNNIEYIANIIKIKNI